MLPKPFRLLAIASLVAFAASPSSAQDDLTSLRKNLADLAKRAQLAGRYAWEGELSLAVQQGQGPLVNRLEAKVQLALANDGQSLVKIQSGGMEEEYWVISNGKKTWSYLPGKKQYAEEEAASDAQDDLDSDDAPEQRGAEAPPIERYAWDAIPRIAAILKNAKAMNTDKTVNLKLAEGKVSWPAIDIESKPDADGVSTIAQLVLAPDRPVVGRLIWAEVKKGQALTIRISIQFNRFSLGEPLPADLFSFDPPKKARLVDEITIPGQPGSALLNRDSPDFSAKTLTGEKVALSDLRGQVVMLSFWASWCPPCRAELPTIAKLQAAYKDKGVAIFGVNDEDRATAKKYLDKAGLDLPTLDDSSQKAHRLYHISAIPTVYIINAQGKVVKYFRGGRSEDTLRSALKAAGAQD